MTTSRTAIAMKPVIASRRGPSGAATPSSACTRNQVATVAPKATPAPAATGLRRARLAPSRLAVTAAKIRIASRPSRNTITAESKTTVAWL